jgi:Acyl carrier protein phosphodiesterase
MLAAMKTNLLVIDSSARRTRSVTRHLTSLFASAWAESRPGAKIVHRDIGLNPPPMIDESWIAAAYTPAEERTFEMEAALDFSNRLIDEIAEADAIVLGAPVYNFGMPAMLKGWVEQIVRVGRTFAMDGPDSANRYRPLLSPKPVWIVEVAGTREMFPGGALAAVNFLETHLSTVLGFIGLTDLRFVRVGDVEVKGEHYQASLAEAETLLRRAAASDEVAEGAAA